MVSRTATSGRSQSVEEMIRRDFQLILKRASGSRLSGEWNDDDFDVLADGAVVGRIFKVHAAPVGAPWCGRSDIRSTACPRTAMPQPARPRWRRSPRVGGGSGRANENPAQGMGSGRRLSGVPKSLGGP